MFSLVQESEDLAGILLIGYFIGGCEDLEIDVVLDHQCDSKPDNAPPINTRTDEMFKSSNKFESAISMGVSRHQRCEIVVISKPGLAESMGVRVTVV